MTTATITEQQEDASDVLACGLGCELPFGHEGLHDDLDGSKWGRRDGR
jgi:hypothetical protein